MGITFGSRAKADDVKAKAKAALAEPLASPTKNSGLLFVKVRAIVGDEPNSNGDCFPREELIKAYKTFNGVPVFASQESTKDAEHAIGKVVSSKYVASDNSVHCVLCVDRAIAPGLARAVEDGYVTGIAMSAQVGHGKCGECHKEFYGYAEACEHMKGDKRKTGVVEITYGLKFIDICFAVDPASDKCRVLEVMDGPKGVIK